MWRHHPLIARGHKAAFPGLRIAVPIFAAYLVADTLFGSDHGHHHVGNITYEKEGVGIRPAAVEGHGDDGHGHH